MQSPREFARARIRCRTCARSFMRKHPEPRLSSSATPTGEVFVGASERATARSVRRLESGAVGNLCLHSVHARPWPIETRARGSRRIKLSGGQAGAGALSAARLSMCWCLRTAAGVPTCPLTRVTVMVDHYGSSSTRRTSARAWRALPLDVGMPSRRWYIHGTGVVGPGDDEVRSVPCRVRPCSRPCVRLYPTRRDPP